MMPATHPDNPVTKERRDRFLSRQSVIEMRARERARALLSCLRRTVAMTGALERASLDVLDDEE